MPKVRTTCRSEFPLQICWSCTTETALLVPALSLISHHLGQLFNWWSKWLPWAGISYLPSTFLVRIISQCNWNAILFLLSHPLSEESEKKLNAEIYFDFILVAGFLRGFLNSCQTQPQCCAVCIKYLKYPLAFPSFPRGGWLPFPWWTQQSMSGACHSLLLGSGYCSDYKNSSSSSLFLSSFPSFTRIWQLKIDLMFYLLPK